MSPNRAFRLPDEWPSPLESVAAGVGSGTELFATVEVSLDCSHHVREAPYTSVLS
jgi:hypothetical protein